MATQCRSKNPETCPYHGSKPENQMLTAVQNNDYAAYEEAKKKSEAAQKTVNIADNGAQFVHTEQFRNIKKMPALFVIDRTAHKATTAVNEHAAWIFTEPAKPTIKRDGTSITVTEDGTIYARRAVKKGNTAPPGFIAAETDSFTGHTFGLEPIAQSGFSKMFTQAAAGKTLTPGTYELCGPKINGNPESLTEPELLPHGADEATEVPDMRTVPPEEAYETLKKVFATYKERGIEGVVWWGANGKRAKLRVKDFFGDPNRRF